MASAKLLIMPKHNNVRARLRDAPDLATTLRRWKTLVTSPIRIKLQFCTIVHAGILTVFVAKGIRFT